MRTEGKGWARGSSRRGSGAAVGGARCGPVRRPSDNFKRCGRRGKLLPAADLEVVGGVETAAAASDRGSCVGRGGGARDGTSRDDREGDSVSGRGMRNTVSSDNIRTEKPASFRSVQRLHLFTVHQAMERYRLLYF
jgi:hypothetical protein